MVERKYLAHFISTTFDITNGTQNYVRIGSYLEQYQEEMNPQVDVRQNILGEQFAIHNGYQVSSSAEPFYIDITDGGRDKDLSDKLQDIANGRLTGDECKTYRVDALFDTEGNCLWAYREECLVVPQSVGGDTSGVQIPYQVINVGNRASGVMTNSGGSWSYVAYSITVSPTTASITGTGTQSLTATTTPSGGTVSWKSSNTAVATVSSAGVVTGVTAGVAEIIASFKGMTAKCKVTVS